MGVMTKMRVIYQENFSTECIHESGAKFQTQLPKDLGGEGKAFSPTDLLATSLASCMLTLMAIAAKKIAFDLRGTTVEVEKEMVSDPQRRIGKLIVRIRCPRAASQPIREKLEKAALTCPVHLSLHPNVKQEVDFIWGI